VDIYAPVTAFLRPQRADFYEVGDFFPNIFAERVAT
jgi:hypothetical protein